MCYNNARLREGREKMNLTEFKNKLQTEGKVRLQDWEGNFWIVQGRFPGAMEYCEGQSGKFRTMHPNALKEQFGIGDNFTTFVRM